MENLYYIPDKSYEEWKEEWIVLNCDSSKEHFYEYVYKISEAGRVLLYEQCQSCGMRKTTNTLKHDTVPYLKYKIETNQIKKFSQELEDNGPTYTRYYNEYYNIEKDKFNRKKQEEYQQKQEKMSKRVKINFETVNAGKYTVIPGEEIAQVNKRIREAMIPVVREYKQKEFQSWRSASQKKIC